MLEFAKGKNPSKSAWVDAKTDISEPQTAGFNSTQPWPSVPINRSWGGMAPPWGMPIRGGLPVGRMPRPITTPHIA